MSEKSCEGCLYYEETDDGATYCVEEQCFNFSGWRSKQGQPITFVDKVKVTTPLHKDDYFGPVVDDAGPLILPEEKFSLDKLIDDHWKYNEGLVKLCFPYGVDGWETDDILRLVEFAYKQSGKHFWKHCVEHYGIEEKNDD